MYGLQMRSILLFLLASLILITSTQATLKSALFGRLTGTVVDQSGVPIPSASVRLDGTPLGVASEIDGRFRLTAITPGFYTVLVSNVGYRPQQILEVQITSGRTTTLTIELAPQTMNLDPVTVTFKKPPVSLDETHERVSVTQKTIAELPVRRSDHMLQYQPGMVIGPGGDVHVRGGRSGSVEYVVDGMRVEDPVAGRRAANIGREGMEEVQFHTGTFNAEYGSSMSGVVNIYSREGGEKYRGSIEWESPMLNDSPYRDDNDSRYDPATVLDNQDPWIPTEGRYSGTLSGPVPFFSPMTFFLHGVHEAETKTEPFGDKWVRRITGKLALPVDDGKLALSFGLRGRDDQPYNHQWKYNADQYHRRWERNNRASLTWTDSVNPFLYYDLTAGIYHRTYDVKVFQTWDEYLASDWQVPELGLHDYFYEEDDWSDTWSESEATSLVASGELNWYPDPRQEVTGGVEVRREQLRLVDIEITGIGWNEKMIGKLNSFDESPVEFAAWGQDRYELDRWVFRGGLRYDYANPGGEGVAAFTNGSGSTRLKTSSIDPKYQLSPRLGVSYRMLNSMSLHAGYGHFFQMPDYEAMFINAASFSARQARQFEIVGNTDLEPQRTVSYELGLKHALSDYVGYAVTGFYNDVSDLVSARRVFDEDGQEYLSYENIDESRSYGIEVSVRKTFGDFWSLDLNYTLSWAEEMVDGEPGNPLLWDRRHTSNTVFAWQTGRKYYPELFGTSVLQGASIGLLTTISSGLPNPGSWSDDPYVQALNPDDSGADFLRVDVRVAKSFWWDDVVITPFVTVDNIFDRQNPIEVGSKNNYAAYEWDGDLGVNVPTNDIDPTYWDIPRIVRAGVQLSY